MGKNKQKRKDKKNKEEAHDENDHNEKQEVDPPEADSKQDLPRILELAHGDSDVQEQPKRKKKKKTIMPTDGSRNNKVKNEEQEVDPLEADVEEQPKRKKKKKPIVPTEEQEVDSPEADLEQDLPRKRELADDDSDDEEQPKRKKKKKPIVPTDGSGNKKGQKSIRQMKREKFAQRQAEAQAVVKDQHKSECLNYLSQWKHNKQNWKFMKAKQIWLCKNKFSTSLIPDASWPMLLEYFDSTQGNIRKVLLEDANKIIKQLDDWTESQNKEESGENEENATEVAKPDDNVYKRARDLIQCLGE